MIDSITNFPKPANKNLSIKEATDDELDRLLSRLRRERDAQMIIREMIVESMTVEEKRAKEFEYPVSLSSPVNTLYHTALGKDYLQHHGILGMKWGVRRYQNKDGTRKTFSEKRAAKKQLAEAKKEAARKAKIPSSDYIQTQAIREKSVQAMTNEELAVANRRRKLETEYAKLNPEKVSAWKKFTKELIGDTGKTLAKDYANKWAKMKVDEMLKNKKGSGSPKDDVKAAKDTAKQEKKEAKYAKQQYKEARRSARRAAREEAARRAGERMARAAMKNRYSQPQWDFNLSSGRFLTEQYLSLPGN